MKTKTTKSEAFATVTVKEAIFSRDECDTREAKDGKGTEVRLKVLCTDKFSRLMWFPLKHIDQGADNRLYIPMWLLERKNKWLHATGLVFAKIQLVNRNQEGGVF